MVLGILEGPDLVIVLVIVMVLFGAKRLPELARGLGQAKKEFEDATSDQTKPKSAAPTPAATPAEAPALAAGTTADTVTLSRAEYERLRQAGGAPADTPGT